MDDFLFSAILELPVVLLQRISTRSGAEKPQAVNDHFRLQTMLCRVHAELNCWSWPQLPQILNIPPILLGGVVVTSTTGAFRNVFRGRGRESLTERGVFRNV